MARGLVPVGIRELVEADLDAVVAIESLVNPRPWSRALLRAEIDLPPRTRDWLVADHGESGVVGFGGVMYTPDEAHLMLIGVEPAHGRQGIGLALCLALFSLAAARVDAITLEVRADNHGARALYEKLGMSASGRRPRYYADGEDAVIYWLRELAAPATADRFARLDPSTRPTTGDRP